MEILLTLLIAVGTGIGALIGYLFGAYRGFREAKQKAYQELLPPILQLAFHAGPTDEAYFNEALCKLWLYGSREVAKKMKTAVSVICDPTLGDLETPLRETVVEMRNDVQRYWQFWKRQSIEPADVVYVRFGARR